MFLFISSSVAFGVKGRYLLGLNCIDLSRVGGKGIDGKVEEPRNPDV